MKRASLIALYLMILLSSVATVAGAAPSAADETGPRLEPIEISWALPAIYPGDDVSIEVKYKNVGTAAVPPDQATYQVVIQDAVDTAVRVYEGEKLPIPGAASLKPGETSTLRAPVTAPTPGNYNLVVILSLNGVESGNLSVPFPVEQVLPEGLGRLFAGLGMFAAVMAIVAVGAEVTIDTLRVMLGFKRKVTAMEAFDKLRDQLPGQLSALGVAAPELKEFQAQVEGMRAILKKPLDMAEAKGKIQGGQFGQALNILFTSWDVPNYCIPVQVMIDPLKASFKKKIDSLNVVAADKIKDELAMHIDQLAKSLGEAADVRLVVEQSLRWLEQSHGPDLPVTFVQQINQQISAVVQPLADESMQSAVDQLQEKVKQQLEPILRNLLSRLGISDAVVGDLIKRLNEAIDNIDARQFTVEKLLDVMAPIFRDEGPQLSVEWLEQQSHLLVQEGKASVLEAYENYAKPVLDDFGLDTNLIRGELDRGLGFLEAKSRLAMDTYVTSIKELLLVVEKRRNQVQSPFRKLWRTLRDAYVPVWAILIPLVVWMALAPLMVFSVSLKASRFWGLMAAAPLLALILGLVTNWLIVTYVKKNQQESLSLDSRWKGLKAFVERAGDQDRELLRKAKVIQALENLSGYEAYEAAKRYGVRGAAALRWIIYYSQSPQSEGSVEEILRDEGSFQWWWKHQKALLSLGDVLRGVETLWNFVLRRSNEMGQVPSTIKEKIDALELTQVAAILEEREDQHHDEEASRLRWLRALALAIGVVLAYLLQIDAAKLLEAAVPGIAGTINVFTIEGAYLHNNIWRVLPAQHNITPGIILTGLAASAGSAFWHDQLDRLQSAKQQAEEAAKLVRQAKSMIESQD